jgi:CRISPR/Cas system-associated exonuclease Cas4 (RecB family)
MYKCDTNPQTRNAYKKETPPTAIGKLIHASLNDYYKLKASKRNLDNLRVILKQKFMVHYAKHVAIFKTQEKTNQYIKDAVNQLDNFINSKLSKIEPYKTENFFPPYYINKELVLNGRYDRIDIDNDQLTLIDYKTGSLWEDESTDFQIDFYHYLISKTFPQYKIAKKVLFYLKENKIIEKDTRNDLGQIENNIIFISETIRNDNTYEPKKNNLCRFCDYEPLCSIYK